MLAGIIATSRPDQIERIVICFTHGRLLEKDERLYDRLETIAGTCPIAQVYSPARLAEEVTPTTLVIHDEFDYWLLDKTYKIIPGKYVIGFSATNFKDAASSEANFL